MAKTKPAALRPRHVQDVADVLARHVPRPRIYEAAQRFEVDLEGHSTFGDVRHLLKVVLSASADQRLEADVLGHIVGYLPIPELAKLQAALAGSTYDAAIVDGAIQLVATGGTPVSTTTEVIRTELELLSPTAVLVHLREMEQKLVATDWDGCIAEGRHVLESMVTARFKDALANLVAGGGLNMSERHESPKRYWDGNLAANTYDFVSTYGSHPNGATRDHARIASALVPSVALMLLHAVQRVRSTSTLEGWKS